MQRKKRAILIVVLGMLMVGNCFGQDDALTAREALVAVESKALEYSSDAKLVTVAYSKDFVGTTSFSLTSGKADSWVYMFYSQEKDSVIGLHCHVVSGSVEVDTTIIFQASVDLRHPVISGWKDSPNVINAIMQGEAGSFVSSRQNVELVWMGLYQALWNIRLSSDTDTLMLIVDALTNAVHSTEYYPVSVNIPTPSEFGINSIYPQPLSLRSSSVLNIEMTVATRAELGLAFVDNIGRTVSPLVKHTIEPPGGVVHLSVPPRLHFGLYFLKITSRVGATLRPVIVLK